MTIEEKNEPKNVKHIRINTKKQATTDPDTVSKRRLIQEYNAMKSELANVTIKLFFYSPNDKYFDRFTEEQRDQLTLAAAKMYSDKSESDEK